MNLFLAVLKVKFAKAQTIFLAKTAGLGSRRRKNTFAKIFSTVKSGISEVRWVKSRVLRPCIVPYGAMVNCRA
jgi:hypothetical protein